MTVKRCKESQHGVRVSGGGHLKPLLETLRETVRYIPAESGSVERSVEYPTSLHTHHTVGANSCVAKSASRLFC